MYNFLELMVFDDHIKVSTPVSSPYYSRCSLYLCDVLIVLQ